MFQVYFPTDAVLAVIDVQSLEISPPSTGNSTSRSLKASFSCISREFLQLSFYLLSSTSLQVSFFSISKRSFA